MRSRPDRKRSWWNWYADSSLSFDKFKSAADLATALISLRCVVYEVSDKHSSGKEIPYPTYEVGHGLKLNATGHATRSTRFFYFTFVRFCQNPDRVIGMAEYPEVVSANIRKLLQVGLV